MLTETGRVVAVENDGLWVETIRQSTCGSCSASKGCGHSLLNKIGDGRRSLVRVIPCEHSPGEYAVGQSVRIGIPETVVLRSSFVVYILPLLLMLLGAGSVPALAVDWSGDLAALCGAALGLAVGVALIRVHAWQHRMDPELQPQLLGPADSQESLETGLIN